MTEPTSAEASGDGVRGSQANTGNKLQAKSVLTKIAAFVADRNIPFLVCSIGMIVMLLWAGKFKMTAPGAEGIIPLVMLITTPDDTIVVHGMHYMNNLGLFLFKDIISFGVAFYLISYYGGKAITAENQR